MTEQMEHLHRILYVHVWKQFFLLDDKSRKIFTPDLSGYL